jgi:hypothetical protein
VGANTIHVSPMANVPNKRTINFLDMRTFPSMQVARSSMCGRKSEPSSRSRQDFALLNASQILTPQASHVSTR